MSGINTFTLDDIDSLHDEELEVIEIPKLSNIQDGGASLSDVNHNIKLADKISDGSSLEDNELQAQAFGEPNPNPVSEDSFDPNNNSDIEEVDVDSFDPNNNSDIEEVDITNTSESEELEPLDPIQPKEPEPEEEIAEPEDPEDELAEPEDPENELTEPEEVEELLEGEFIIDDEEFLIEEQKETMVITEEEVIPENKVIANETDQQNNLFNQLMKLIPEELKTNPKYLKKISNIQTNLVLLKLHHSITDDDKNIVGPKINGSNYKPLLENYKQGNFTSKYLIPIISDIKDLYKIQSDEKELLIDTSLDEISDTKANKLENSPKINTEIGIREKYRKGRARVNYSYYNEANEYNNSQSIYRPRNGYHIKLDKDTQVYRNTYSDNAIAFNKSTYDSNKNHSYIALGDKYTYSDRDIPLTSGETIAIQGFLKMPRHKNQIKKLHKHRLFEIINSKYSLKQLNQNIETLKIEYLNLLLEKDAEVKLCISPENITIRGIITEIEGDDYIINPIKETPDEEIEQMKINRYDSNIKIIDVNNTCQPSDEEVFKIFVYLNDYVNENIGENDYHHMLESLIPSSKSVISKITDQSNIHSIDDLQKYLDYYDMTLEDCTYDDLKSFIDLLKTKRSQQIITIEQNRKEYQNFLKNPSQIVNTKVPFITNAIIKELKQYYGEYPHFNKSIDSIQTRLDWITSQPDNGNLFFQNIVKNIKDKIKSNPDLIKQNLNAQIEKIEQSKTQLEISVENEKKQLVAEKNPCLNMHIVKTYSSKEELENDNQKDINIDSDKIIYGQEGNLVKEGHYALLKNDQETKLFKRITLPNGGDIWNLETIADIDFVVKTNKDFCEQQLKNLSEINTYMLTGYNACKFSDVENQCIPASLNENIIKLDLLNNKLKELYKNLNEVQEEDEDVTEKNIEYYQQYLDLVNNLEKRKYINVEKDIAQDVSEVIDPQYEQLYNKIDLYLEKISKLDNKSKYILLDDLIKKYSRIANVSANENPNFLYCKYGNKKICCKCNTYLINSYKEPKKSREIILELLEIMGIESDGTYWCTNCGQELYDGEYETLESFKKGGARDVTSEVLEEETYESKYENPKLMESLKKYLDEDESQNITDQNVLDIIKIIKSLTNIMGITLLDVDELKIIKETRILCQSNIKNKTDWSQTAKVKKKSIDKAYEVYRNMNTILYSVCILFITLQTSIPSYIPTKTHSKCKNSLDGFPLNNTNQHGIDYISCILDELRKSNESWKSLKKIKLQDMIKKILEKLVKDDLISYNYQKKNDHLKTLTEHKKLEKRNVWGVFRPPLDNFSIENKRFDSMNLEALEDNRELTHYYSLKIINEIDTIINQTHLTGPIFDGAPLDNSCCQEYIKDYDTFSYFINSNDRIRVLLDKATKMESLSLSSQQKDMIYAITHHKYDSLPSFSRDIYPNEEDVLQSDIIDLYKNYVATGDQEGTKHIYENNKCIITGEDLKTITSTEYSIKDYYSLLDIINYRNLIPNQFSDESINILNNIKQIIADNPYLNSNVYLTNFLDELVKSDTIEQTNKIWADLNTQLVVEIENVQTIFSEVLGADDALQVSTNLTKLGMLQNISEDNIQRYGEAYAYNDLFNQQLLLLKKYLYNNVFGTISKIKNSKTNEDFMITDIPTNWKIELSYYDNLIENISKENSLVDKYVTNKIDNNDTVLYEDLMYEISYMNKNLRSIVGESHVSNCDGSNNKYSKCTNANVAALFHLIFVLIIKSISDYEEYLQKSSNRQSHTFIKDDDIHSLTTEKKYVLDDTELVSQQAIQESIENEQSGGADVGVPANINEPNYAILEKLEEINTRRKITVCQLIRDILAEIESDRAFLDSHSETKIQETIEKKMDLEKEDNLKFIEELDKESRQALKNMISIGLDTWKNLSGKQDKELYFERGNDEQIEEPENPEMLVHNEEDMDAINRNQAMNELGDNYNEDRYQEWLQSRNISNREDREAYEERDIMPDDDGDVDGDFDPYNY